MAGVGGVVGQVVGPGPGADALVEHAGVPRVGGPPHRRVLPRLEERRVAQPDRDVAHRARRRRQRGAGEQLGVLAVGAVEAGGPVEGLVLRGLAVLERPPGVGARVVGRGHVVAALAGGGEVEGAQGLALGTSASTMQSWMSSSVA
jgi:hypothetical protein